MADFLRLYFVFVLQQNVALVSNKFPTTEFDFDMCVQW